MTNDGISVTFQPTLGHYLAVTSYLTFRGVASTIFLALFPLAGFVLLACHVWLSIPTGPFDVFAILVAILLVPILILATSCRLYWRNKGIAVSLTIDDAGISAATKDSTISHKWTAITKVRKTSRFLMLHFAARCAYFVPIELVGDEQLARVTAIAGRHQVICTGF